MGFNRTLPYDPESLAKNTAVNFERWRDAIHAQINCNQSLKGITLDLTDVVVDENGDILLQDLDIKFPFEASCDNNQLAEMLRDLAEIIDYLPISIYDGRVA